MRASAGISFFTIVLAAARSGGDRAGNGRRGRLQGTSPLTSSDNITSTTVTYGEYCHEGRGLVCNSSSAFLKCTDNRCACLRQEDMIFDVVRGQCVVKAGAKCTFGEDELGKGRISMRDGRSVGCVLNAVCGVHGHCECKPRFYNSLNVTCIPQKSFHAYCHFHSECREDHHLRCIAGGCHCDPAVSTKHRKYDICLGLAGEAALDGNCVEFTERVSLSSLSPVKCECQDGYVKGVDKKCHGSFRRSCSTESPCQRKFMCIQGICQCPAQDYQTFDPERQKCMGNAFSPCKQSSDCIPQAFCNTSTGTGGECVCRTGYIVGLSRTCEKSVGTPCQIVPEGGVPRFVLGRGRNETRLDDCSASAGLICMDGLCSCPTMRVFSDKFEKCVGLVGSICIEGEEDDPICVENASCTYKFKRLGYGLCTCNPGFLLTPDRQCEEILEGGVTQIEDEFATDNMTTTEVPVSTTSKSSEIYTPLIPENVDVAKLKNDTRNKHLWEFFKFLNDTLHGGFDNASFTRFMNSELFRLPD